MSNPYQPFFDKLDATTDTLSKFHPTDEPNGAVYQDAIDLLKRAGFVLANMLNVQAQVYPTLFLEPVSVQGEITREEVEQKIGPNPVANDTDSTSLVDPETHDDIMAQDYE